MKTKIFVILALIILVVPVTVLATKNAGETDNNISSQSDDYVVCVTKEEVDEITQVFTSECPDQIIYLESALNKAKIFDDTTGELKALDLTILEKELNSLSLGRNKLRFFIGKFLWSDFGNYEAKRTNEDPFNRGQFAIRWCFESVPKGSRKIELYDNYYYDGDFPYPEDEPMFYATKIWFHDFTLQSRWSWETKRIGCTASYIWAIGGEEKDSSSVSKTPYTRMIKQFPILEKILQILYAFRGLNNL